MGSKIFVIGIGYSPLSESAREMLSNSNYILTSTRLLEVFSTYPEYESVKDRVILIDGVENTIQFIRNLWEDHSTKQTPLAVLASGDPMFYGIGRRLSQEFGKEKIQISPELSSIQIAFALIKEPWDNAFLMSVHGGPYPGRRINRYEVEDIPYFLSLYGKVCVLTDPRNNPSLIAKTLYNYFGDEPYMYVLERLGYKDERIVQGKPNELTFLDFRDPNVVIVILPNLSHTPRFGLTESEISHKKGLITKDEVRALVIHKLKVPSSGIVWDIGAGSGSISLELSLLFPELTIFAVEKDLEMLTLLEENKKRYKARYKIIPGEAPQILSNLPKPHRVFIGGSGGRLLELLDAVINAGPEILVLTVALLENLCQALPYLREKGYEVDVTQLCAFRSKDLEGMFRLSPQNPIFVISGRAT